jgi:hypothetical protein
MSSHLSHALGAKCRNLKPKEEIVELATVMLSITEDRIAVASRKWVTEG